MTSLVRFLTEDHLDCDGLFADAENAVSMGDWSAAGLANRGWPLMGITG